MGNLQNPPLRAIATMPWNWGLDHDAVEDAQDFTRTVGHGDGFAPGTGFGNAEGMLAENMGFDVVFGADDEQGENARIGVEGRNWGRTIGHGSCFTPLRN